ncbi:MAG: transcription antitermination factor NusB [Spirochaetia bacterium]|jgi:N utilization substance protein B|nr:transcription antitermination factor NusB [Spirochaetia bacterium]
MSARRKARILAFQALYAWEASKSSLEELLSLSWLDAGKLDQMDEETLAFTRLMIAQAVENSSELDRRISLHLAHWPFERLKKVDLAILRMGAVCLLFQPEISPKISIDEAIEIAKEYGSEESYKFINGVLDGIRRDLETENKETPAGAAVRDGKHDQKKE